MGCTDILAIHHNRYIRVQVKSRDTPYRNRYDFFIAKGGKKERMTIEDCDILALVGLPHRQVYFLHMDDMGTGKHKKILCSKFADEELARSTWNRALGVLDNCDASMRSRNPVDVTLGFQNVVVPMNVMCTCKAEVR